MTSERKPKVLMCPPTEFGVQYVINPWMDGNVGMANRDTAQQQWDKLFDIISQKNHVDIVEPLRQMPDMCFVANAGLLLEDIFIPSRFRVQQRVAEVPGYQQWFETNKYIIKTLPDDCEFEGEGDALFQPTDTALTDSKQSTENDGHPLLWAGYGCRSNLQSYGHIAELLRVDVAPLRLVDKRFYHLDTCFLPLPGQRVIYYPPAFDAASLNIIHNFFKPENRIAVSDSDALGFCCNAVRLGNCLIVNHASTELQKKLKQWDYDVLVTPLSEFILAGGAAKCLTLYLRQPVSSGIDKRPAPNLSIRTSHVELRGDLLDSGVMNRALDIINDGGGDFSIEQFNAGLRHDQASIGRIKITAAQPEILDTILNDLQVIGANILNEHGDANLIPAPADGIAPEGFYSTTIYPTDVQVNKELLRVSNQRMDVVIVIDDNQAHCTLIRDLRAGDQVVCGVEGVFVKTPAPNAGDSFAFMASGVSSERRVERAVDELAWEMQRIRARDGRIVVVAGPVVIHTGGSRHLVSLINTGYVQTILTGNALPVHDIELNMFGTSLGVDMDRGTGVPHGHQHHLRAINRVRAAGSIRAAVEQGIISGGVMHACVKNNVEYVLAGSIRDDGPLPDTEMDLVKAQAAYAKSIAGAEMVLMLSSMLHAIGTGNMTPAGVRMICVDINPAVVTKLADRGSIESTGIVTDVGLFLNLLAQRLK